MILLLKLSTFDLKSIKELIFKIQNLKKDNTFTLISTIVFPIKKIKRTVLRAPHGDKKTGQDSLQLSICRAQIQISISKLEHLKHLLNFIIPNSLYITFSFISSIKG